MPFKEEVASRGQIRKEIGMKGLEALERLMSKYNEMCLDTGCNDDEYQNGNTTSERAVIERELKALEIIKEKEVDINSFGVHLILGWDYNLFERYCGDNNPYEEYPPYQHSMTKDEFDLLKEVLG